MLPYDEFDPDNLDIEDMVRKRWKSKKGKIVGMPNNGLPNFKKQFINPKQSIDQPMPEKTREFVKDKEIAIKSLDGQPCPFPFLTWESTQFHKQIINTINRLQFRTPTPIQSVVFPLILSGYDVIGVAETGSGKTFGYLLPGLIQIACQNYPQNFRNNINGPEMLILAPTRELVMQITSQVEEFARSYNFKVTNAFGGPNRDQQARQILENPNILVACPGRLKDFLQEGILDLSKVTYLVIDEADKLLDMGFEDDVRYIVEKTRMDRQTVFFSATWPKAVRNLSFDFCSEHPIYVQIGRSNLTINKNIDQEIICLFNNEKLKTLLDILDTLKINDKVLIFAETRRSCEQLSLDMTNEGYYAVALHGDKSQRQRDEIMKNYKSGETKLLCATDLASRGLDVSDITVVINYDFPKYFDDYIHRIGRTGRAGRKGRAFSFFSVEKDKPQMARELLKFNQVHQIKFDFQIMQDLANGIKQQRNPNYQQGPTKYNGQIMDRNNNGNNETIFRVPNLTEEEKAKLYLQPHQYETIENRNKQNYNGRQYQGKHNYGQQQYRQNQRGEEIFYQNKFRKQNQGQYDYKGQQEQNQKSNRFRQQSDFQGQRREDYLEFDSGRQDFEKNYSGYGNQGSNYRRQDDRRQNNEQDKFQRYQDNRREQFDQNKGNKEQFFVNQREQQQPFSNQRDYQKNEQDFMRNQQDSQQWSRTSQNQYQFSNQRPQENKDQRNFQNDQYRTPYNNSRNYPSDKNYNTRKAFDNVRDERQFENYKDQNYRQQNNWEDRGNKQGLPQRQYNQQDSKSFAPDNYRDINFDQDFQKRFQQDNNRERFSNQQNDNFRTNNSRNFVDVTKPQDDLQIRKDSSQQLDSKDLSNLNNFNHEVNQSQDKQKNSDINSIQQRSLDTQRNQDQNVRLQNQRSFDNFNQEQEKGAYLRPQSQQGDFQASQNSQMPQIKQEQQFYNQQFEQKPVQNNFVYEKQQNQPQNNNYDRQINLNQRPLLDKKMDQIPQNLENQSRQNNQRPNFIQQKYSDNNRQSQDEFQSINRNERVQDYQDNDQMDFTRYSREVDDTNKKFELEQAPNSNYLELKDNRKNSDQQQIQNLQQNELDSQIQY
ncbi:unnamed protein product [Paramecium sonneborni]|uniref:RNA helicase n=1 Tax=Paramecium sonneborni TaxID=65129 RepID=A0A8S1MEZ4_9CILI|nr:unnamed protein product [Paramecium sonneborni]